MYCTFESISLKISLKNRFKNMPPYRDFELLRGEVVLQPVVDLALEVLVLLHLLDLLGLLLLVPYQILLIVVLQREGGQ